MSRFACKLATALLLLWLASCSRPGPGVVAAAPAASPPPSGPSGRAEVRITGVVEAVRAVHVVVPRVQGQSSSMTLTELIENGSQVKEGDLIARFDPTQQMDAARDAQAKFDDLGHQVEQKIAENRANAERRTADVRQAEGDMQKAQWELKKGPTLAEIDRVESEARAAGASKHLESLRKSQAARQQSEVAALRILELQRDRQKVAIQRAQDNIHISDVRAPLAGMVVHELTYRAGSYGHAQVGDQIYRGYPLVSIFDPSEMQVRCSINEPDILSLRPGSPVSVRLDAYADVVLPGHLNFVSPVASIALGTPIKSFIAVFHIDKVDSHLLPDLSAAVLVSRPPAAGGGAR